MELIGLKPLYSSMIMQNLKRTKFSVTINNAIFELIYFIDSVPHTLAIGVRNENLFFMVEVKKGFIINPYLGKKFGLIYKILGLSPNGASSFSPKNFYDEINKGIPSTTSPKNTPKPYDIAAYRPKVEESHKIYFCGWLDNNVRNEKVRPKNLIKTQQWLDQEAYEMCKKYNISSCWSPHKSKEKSITKPTSILKK
ncbi:DUF6037 family protein [Psychrobacillus sp.]|uniref:DUF6037 family protein n=1 Tax=Psychrobacillus sp. TaxID=1871623 RepID=UPI0028BD2520|nr:DUF6037 family protein [Psychrobacillus sp.]